MWDVQKVAGAQPAETVVRFDKVVEGNHCWKVLWSQARVSTEVLVVGAVGARAVRLAAARRGWFSARHKTVGPHLHASDVSETYIAGADT